MVRSLGRLVAVPFIAALVSLGLVAGMAITAPTSAYADGATFNVPRPWANQAAHVRIVTHIEKAIRQTRPTKADPKPVILITSFLLDRTTSVTALIGACRRGVSVRVILDHDIVNRNSKRLIRALNGDNVRDRNHDGKPDRKAKRGKCNRPLHRHHKRVDGAAGKPIVEQAPLSDRQAMRSASRPTDASVTWGRDRSYVKRCKGSCRGGGGNMHSKFYAFSHTGHSRNVIMVSSSNLNRGGAYAGWNDLYTMRNRPKSFAAYKRVHREMTNDRRAGRGKVEVRDGPYTSRFFPMHKTGMRRDPTMVDLNRIHCRGPMGRTAVNVSMFYWKGKRGSYLANKLLGLARHGCRVSILYGAPSRLIAERLRNAARRHLINLWDTRWDFNDDGYNEVRTHAKYVLVRGHYGKRPRSWQVMTGTQNWVAGSLSLGDENSLNIALKSAYKQYLGDWNMIRAHSRRLPYHW